MNPSIFVSNRKGGGGGGRVRSQASCQRSGTWKSTDFEKCYSTLKVTSVRLVKNSQGESNFQSQFLSIKCSEENLFLYLKMGAPSCAPMLVLLTK